MTPLLAQLSLLAAAAALLVAAASDLRRFLIPDGCSLALLGAFALFALSGATMGAWPLHLLAGLVAFVLGAALFAARLFGGGDVKLFAATALWAGPALAMPLVLAMALAGGLLVLLIAARLLAQRALAPAGGPADSLRAQPVPYGIAIAAGGLFVLAARAGLLA
jgi:prepilin peptidase CpaA